MNWAKSTCIVSTPSTRAPPQRTISSVFGAPPPPPLLLFFSCWRLNSITVYSTSIIPATSPARSLGEAPSGKRTRRLVRSVSPPQLHPGQTKVDVLMNLRAAFESGSRSGVPEETRRGLRDGWAREEGAGEGELSTHLPSGEKTSTS